MSLRYIEHDNVERWQRSVLVAIMRAATTVGTVGWTSGRSGKPRVEGFHQLDAGRAPTPADVAPLMGRSEEWVRGYWPTKQEIERAFVRYAELDTDRILPGRTHGLTALQRRALAAIVRGSHDGRPPTLRELGELIMVGSTNGVQSHVEALRRKGWLDGVHMQARANTPTAKAWAASCYASPIRALSPGANRLPVLLFDRHNGRIRQTYLENLVVDSRVVAQVGQGGFAYRVEVSSAEPAVMPGDLLICRRAGGETLAGEIAVVDFGGGVPTVLRVREGEVLGGSVVGIATTLIRAILTADPAGS